MEDPNNAGMAKLYNFGLVKGWANRDLEGASEYVMNLEGEMKLLNCWNFS